MSDTLLTMKAGMTKPAAKKLTLKRVHELDEDLYAVDP